jgi:hypothetical protein
MVLALNLWCAVAIEFRMIGLSRAAWYAANEFSQRA